MRRAWLSLAWGTGLAALGASVIVLAAMATVAMPEVHQKAAGIALAIAGVWALSRGGTILYGLLLAR